MPETPNHGYNVPEAGTQDWHGPLNENFEAFEVDIEIRDAGEPSANGYDPADGAKYLDTDTGTVYLGDGDSWMEAFSFGGGITGLTGGNGINPGTIGDGNTLSVAWSDATDLASDGSVDQLSGPLTGGQALTDIAGTNLSIDSNGTLNASGGGDGRISSLTGGDGINPGTIGDGDTVSVAWSDAASLDSNGNVKPGRYMMASGGQVDFAGPAEWSNAGSTDTNTASDLNATVAGGLDNTASASEATVAGGGSNTASSDYATVAGGNKNTASGEEATVAGGQLNNASGKGATVAGGNGNTASADYATVGGGAALNKASADYATVGGGGNNNASGEGATVGGGETNTASGEQATVPGGKRGAAEGDHSFVWSDKTPYHDIPNTDDDGLSSNTAVDGEPVTGANTFSVSATGGVRFITGGESNPNVTYIPGDSAGWTTTSSRAVKTNIDPVEPREALDGVESMEIATWEYESEDGGGAGTTHIGPMAGDFHEAFDVGSSDEHINSINADGVAFAAIQGLSAKLDERDERIEELETTVKTQREELDEKDERIADLESRLAAVEDQLGDGDGQ